MRKELDSNLKVKELPRVDVDSMLAEERNRWEDITGRFDYQSPLAFAQKHAPDRPKSRVAFEFFLDKNLSYFLCERGEGEWGAFTLITRIPRRHPVALKINSTKTQ